MKLSKLSIGILMLISTKIWCSGSTELSMEARTVRNREVVLSIEEAQLIVDAWERLESQMRSAREDTSNGAAVTDCCGSNTDLAIIRTCICAIKNQLCSISQQIGTCGDLVITEITEDLCVTQAEINAICASLQSWVKTIVSELRGNQDVCPIS